jgi:hypothetical protein
MGMGIVKDKEKKIYLGYRLIRIVNGNGWGGYANYSICYGSTPEEVMRSYFYQHKNLKFAEENMVIKSDDDFYYRSYFDILFMKLPNHQYCPQPLLVSMKL